MPFQAHSSLAGTLAAYEERQQALRISSSKKSGTPYQAPERASAEDLYKRTLPSLHFLRWRPLFHLQAPSGWINDPCAPGYDPSTGLYHLFYQWNPKRNEYGAVAWGSIAWGHATSTDLVSWMVDGKAAVKPGAWYDKEGCFTGCMVPTDLTGNPGMTMFYTGVSRLPLHYTLPYKTGTETLSIFQPDGSGSFVKMRGNPVLSEAPEGIDISGFRDPFVAQWPSIDRILGEPEGQTLYGAISGGVKDRSPTVFLFAVNPQKLTQWVFLDAIVDLGLNHNISRWSGDMGINWECANFMTLTSGLDGSSRDFIVTGAEGADGTHPNSTFTHYPQSETKFPRTERSLQWMSGRLVPGAGKNGQRMPKIEYLAGGRFDHGLMYGVNSFCDPGTKKQIAWGWVTEEDLPQRLIDRQNWSGVISLPRELSLICIRHVTGTLRSPLNTVTSFELEQEDDIRYTIRTLGISPAPQLKLLRNNTRYMRLTGPKGLTSDSKLILDVQTNRFEMVARFQVRNHCQRIGFTIYHSQDLTAELSTSLYLVISTETLVIERTKSTHVDPEIVTHAERAPFTLLTIAAPGEGTVREELEIRAFFDESILEVFANDRCTFATRVYPATKRCYGMRFWSEDDEDQSILLDAEAWDGVRADIKVA